MAMRKTVAMIAARRAATWKHRLEVLVHLFSRFAIRADATVDGEYDGRESDEDEKVIH